MKFPCRKDEVANGDGKGNANEWSIGYNYCLEECKAAYEQYHKQYHKLLPLDKKELADWVCTSDWNEIISTEIARQLCARFGCPDIPTVEEIKSIMDKVDHTPVPIDKVNSWTMKHTKYMYAKAIHALLVKGDKK